VQGAERRPGVGAQLVPQRPPVGVVAGEGGGRPAGGGLAAHQLEQDLLVARVGGGQRGQRLDRLGGLPESRQRQRPHPGQRPAGGRPGRAQRAVAAEQGQAALRGGEGRRVVTGPRAALGLRSAQQHRRGVDLLGAECQPVAGRGALDNPGPEPRPGPRHQRLQCLGRVFRHLTGPQLGDEPGRAAPGPQVVGEQREEAGQPGAGDLLAAPAGPGQQGELNRHRRSG
jgi:hypothetical protein